MAIRAIPTTYEVRCDGCGYCPNIEPFDDEYDAKDWIDGKDEGADYPASDRPPFTRYFGIVAGKIYCEGCLEKMIQATKAGAATA